MTHAYAVEVTVGRSTRLDRVLHELVDQVPEIEAASVVSFDGLPMAAALPDGMDEDRVAAMSAALLSLGERAAEGLGRGALSQVYVEGENGTVFLVSADDEAVLVAVAGKGAKVGLMLFEVRRAAEAVAEVLRVEPLFEAVEEPAESVDAMPPLAAVEPVEALEPFAPVAEQVPAEPVAVDPGDLGGADDPDDPFAGLPVWDGPESAIAEPAVLPAYTEAAPPPADPQPALPAAAYQPAVEAYQPLAAPIATSSPSSVSWYAAETILPGAAAGASDPSNWG